MLSCALACTTGATPKDDTPENERDFDVAYLDGISAGASSSAANSVLSIVTVTPMPFGPPPTPASRTGTATETPTATPEAETETLLAEETPTEAAPTEAAPTEEPTVAEEEPPEEPGEEPSLLAVETETPEPSATPEPSTTPTPSMTPTEEPTATPTATETAVPVGGSQGALLEAHNQARAQQGAPPLSIDPTLTSLAQQRAQTMASGHYSHYNPDGTDVFDMMNAAGYAYDDGAENIAYAGGYTEAQAWQVVMQDWLASQGHSEAIHRPNLTRVGFGIVLAPDGRYYFATVFSD